MGLTQLNVWLDVVFTSLYVVILIALSGHFLGNILTGRAKRRFVKDGSGRITTATHPSLPKFLHFQHVVCMIVLGGHRACYIRFPLFNRRAHSDALGRTTSP